MEERYTSWLLSLPLAKNTLGDISLRLTNNIEKLPELTEFSGSTLRARFPVGGRPAAREGGINEGLTVGGVWASI